VAVRGPRRRFDQHRRRRRCMSSPKFGQGHTPNLTPPPPPPPPPPHPPPPKPTTPEEVLEHWEHIAPYIQCQTCAQTGTFTRSAGNKTKDNLICRSEKCTGRISAPIVLQYLNEGNFYVSPVFGLPMADALKQKTKRTRSVSQRDSSVPRRQTAKKVAAQPTPVENGAQELIAQIQNLDPTTSVAEIGPLLIRALQLLLTNNASTPAAISTPPASTVPRTTKTTPSGPSWSDMLKRHKPEERKKVNEELSKLKYQPPVPHQNKTQEAFGFRQVTIRNIAERPINVAKPGTAGFRPKK